MFKLLTLNFLRSRTTIFGLIFLIISGVASIFTGKQFLDAQLENIPKYETLQKTDVERNVAFHSKEMGLLLYYMRFGYVNEFPKLNALSIGQRDVNSSIQSITIRNLEEQRFNTDLYNPINLLYGKLDLGFVIIFLFPMVIIGFMYSILSEEKEAGTWKLLRIQSAGAYSIIWYKSLIRFLVVGAILLILFILSFLIIGVQLDSHFLAFVTLSFLYIIIWFSICLFVISWKKTSDANALSLISIWISLLIILPGMLNSYIISQYPVPEAFSTAIKQREGYHEKWDMDKEVTLSRFFKDYPQFEKYGKMEKQTSWLWYYAMQQMGDDDSREASQQMFAKLRQREKISEVASYFLPSLFTQLHFNDLSQSGLKNYLDFLKSTEDFHEKVRLKFYPKIFEEKDVTKENWKWIKTEFFKDSNPIEWQKIFLMPMLLSCILLIIVNFNFRRISFF